MGTWTVLGIYVGVGLVFAILATVWSGWKRVPFSLFLTIILLWGYLVPHAIRKIIKGK